MIVKKKYIQLALFVLLFSFGACNSDEMSESNNPRDVQEQMVLRLSVQQEFVIHTRGIVVPADEAKVESMDFLIFDHKGDVVYHQHPDLEWTGNEYKTTVNISSATGEHTLYLIANYPMEEGTIHTLQELENKICTSTEALVKPPFVMATRRITLSSLNMMTIRNAMESDGSNGFSLKRNVAKFSVEVTAGNFKLISIDWLGCPVSASVLADVDYISPSTLSVSNLAPLSTPIYLYQIRNMGLDAHKGFHIIVHGKYTAADGTEREGYYKLRLYTIDDATGKKVPLTSIVGNDYYKLNIRSVTGFGANSFENAEKNGFTNDMEAFMLLEYNGTHDYQENYLRNGYQMGFENSRWIIYSNETLNSFVLGHFYRCIRDESLKGYTMFDPDYPNLQRGVITVKANGTEITGETVCNDTPDSPIEMDLCFTESGIDADTEYAFRSIIQYGVLQKTVTVERHPSIGQSYTVLPMLYTNYGEVVGSCDWIGIAEQRHEGAVIYPLLDSANDYIFVHIKENNTGNAREGKVRLFGRNGYFELRIRQEG
ncbi:fimbrial protein [uncultured Bacteroides sp.]|uniref:fimbrial protein n=1 Tax=uncultured Bacteroides sp. TaxID=162156 RepID=UPI0027DE3B9C|nr:fimbrial protein [uncultured Bacteroides sp.]